MGPIRRILISLAAIGAITWIYLRWLPADATTVALTFVLAILVIAAEYGLAEAAAAAFGAILSYAYFFIPPTASLRMGGAHHWISLAAFLATSLIGSQPSVRARRRAAEAERNQLELEKLYALSRGILMTTEAHSGAHIARQAVHALEVPAAALYDRRIDQLDRAGADEGCLSAGLMRQVALTGNAVLDDASGATVLPLQLGGHTVGSLGLRRPAISEPALHSAANLIAIALEHDEAQKLASRAEVARRSEEMKSTLLDALAHEFQTPLTSIKAATSARRDTASAADRELWAIVDEEADRLSTLVAETVQVARLEAGQMRMQKEPLSIAAMVRSVLQQKERALDGRPLRLELQSDLPPACGDSALVRQVFQQLLDNALKYSSPGTEIRVQTRQDGAQVVVTVQDHGPGIDAREQEMIFEKFYRGTRQKGRIPGTGMGLAIARHIVQAHGGCLWVDSQPGEGSSFSFSIPLVKQEVPA